MSFDIRREEAIFIRDLIMSEEIEIGEERLKKIYGNIEIEDLLCQLSNIIFAEYMEEEKE